MHGASRVRVADENPRRAAHICARRGRLQLIRNDEVVRLLDQISWVVTGYAVLVALLAGWSAYRWRLRPPWLDSMAWLLESLLALRAVAGLGSLLQGHEPHQESTHLIYLLASVCIVPLALRSVHDDDGAWSLGVVAVAAVVVAVISVRMVMTL